MNALRVVALIAVCGCTENLNRRPPQLDSLRAAILKEIHLEAEIRVKQLNDHVDLSARVVLFFPHVPPRADKVEIERRARALVKQHLPMVKEVDVQFADNLRQTPLPKPKDGSARGQ